MKKKAVPKKYRSASGQPRMLNEPLPSYGSARALPEVMDFPYKKFAKVAALVPFTQKEWAIILHLSEKTLQRYAKDNKDFEGIYVDRILQMEEMISMGLEAFVNATEFYQWLKKDKPVLGHILNFDSLRSSQGIQLVSNEIGRILHGVYI